MVSIDKILRSEREKRPSASDATSRSRFRKDAAIFGVTLLVLSLSYYLCLEVFFPRYFDPLLPVHKDTFDHWSIGSYSWPVVLDGSRPVAWVLMKLLAPLGLSAITGFQVLCTIGGVALLAYAMQKMLQLQGSSYFLALPLYSLALFCHPEFYVKHRDDFELEASFALLVFAIFQLDVWSANRSALAYLGFLSSIVLYPFAKETFWLSGPVFFWLNAAANRFPKGRTVAAIFCTVTVAAAYFYLRNHSVFFNQKQGSYQESLDARSVVQLLIAYLRLAFTLPTIALCTLGLWNLRKRRQPLFVAIAAMSAGLVAYVPNSLFPLHFINWYAWDGLPFLLVPILAAVASERRNAMV